MRKLAMMTAAVLLLGACPKTAIAEGEHFNIISTNSMKLRLGDVNADSVVDAMDAAMILVSAAAVGAGGESGLTKEQERVAKVLGDESYSAMDAAMILTYAAAKGAGFDGALEDFMAQGGEEGATDPTTTATTVTTTQTTVTTTTTETTTTSATIDPDDYRLEDIKTNAGAFLHFSSGLDGDLLKNNGFQMSYGVTFGARETRVLLAMLNDGLISDEVIKDVFGNFSAEDIKNSIEFIYSLDVIEEFYGTRIDYSKYTLDKEIGGYINQISESKAKGQLDEFVLHTITPQAVPEKITHNTAVVAMLAAYDNPYVTQAIANGFAVDEFVNKLTQLALGDSDTR